MKSWLAILLVTLAILVTVQGAHHLRRSTVQRGYPIKQAQDSRLESGPKLQLGHHEALLQHVAEDKCGYGGDLLVLALIGSTGPIYVCYYGAWDYCVIHEEGSGSQIAQNSGVFQFDDGSYHSVGYC